MLTKHHIRHLLLLLLSVPTLLGLFWACNTSSSFEEEQSRLSSSVEVTDFSLEKNDSVLTSLDSIFFSIDLIKGQIFNADSLPVGTRVDRLIVNIKTPGVSVAEISYRRENRPDSVVDYLKHATDSIDFSQGPVKLHLVALDKTTVKDYEIRVNVHTTDPDSISWSRLARRPLPSSFGVPAHQKTVQAGKTLFCLTSAGSAYSLAYSDNPADNWTTSRITLPDGASLTTFEATADATLYILADDGILFRSTNRGPSWESTGQQWISIVGAYGNRLLGIAQTPRGLVHTTLPPTVESPLEEDFPISGNSRFYSFSDDKWAASSQVMTAGGRNTRGRRLSTIWSYDGNSWICLTDKLPIRAEGLTIIPYCISRTSSASWRSFTEQALLCIGGMTSADTLNRRVFVSRDLGFNWRTGEKLIQLPQYIPAMKASQAYVYTQTNHITRTTSAQWEEMPEPKLPAWLIPARHHDTTRATTALTDWQTPYIYLFGGESAEGTLYNTVWRGVLNRLEFKPIQ